MGDPARQLADHVAEQLGIKIEDVGRRADGAVVLYMIGRQTHKLSDKSLTNLVANDAQLQALMQKADAAKIVFGDATAPGAMSAVLDKLDAIRNDLPGVQIASYGPASGKVVVSVVGLNEAKRKALLDRLGLADPSVVEVRSVEGLGSTLSRAADISPHYGGAFVDPPAGTACSFGFNWVRNGGALMTTAAHCGLGNYYNNDIRIVTNSSSGWGTEVDWMMLVIWWHCLERLAAHGAGVVVGRSASLARPALAAARTAACSSCFT